MSAHELSGSVANNSNAHPAVDSVDSSAVPGRDFSTEDDGFCLPCDVVFLADVQGKVLKEQQESFEKQTMENFDALTHSRVDLIEVCAPWDSPLAEAVERLGGRAFRLACTMGLISPLGLDF